MPKQPDRGYMGAIKGNPCLTYTEFKELHSKKDWASTLGILRSRYVYYVYSWRSINGE